MAEREFHVAVPFFFSDMDHHVVKIPILYFGPNNFGPACPGVSRKNKFWKGPLGQCVSIPHEVQQFGDSIQVKKQRVPEFLWFRSRL